ncbi:MAG: hypothetical protein GVY18_16335 [Bacteroidetes bacterium]|jgi:hypothetical protein|nr:hypothetical protein [Bacteroidota bacterium]
MLRILRLELEALDTGRSALRSFGWLVGAVLLLIGAFVWWRQAWTPGTAVYILGSAGGILVLLGTLAPQWLRTLYIGWMALALLLGFVMTRVLLTLVYVLLVLPIGLLLRGFGKDLLDRSLDPDASTYWRPREPIDDDPERLERYY